MTGAVPVIDAVSALAAAALPELKRIYIGLAPLDCVRPCLLIETVTTQTRRVSAALAHVELFLTLTVFDTTDDYGQSDTGRLLTLQQRVAELFDRGYIAVGDRALPVLTSTGGRDWDKAFVDVQLEYHEVVGGGEPLPLIETVETALTAK